VPAPNKIDVKVAARLAGMSEEEFIALNPAHTKPVAVSSTGTLVVPVDKAEAFRENLENYDKPLVTWTTYTAKRGESLDSIARRHGVSVAQLRSVNDPFKLDRKGRMKVAGPVLVPAKAGKAAPMVRMAAVNVPTASVGAARSAAHVHAGVHVVKPGETLYSIAQRYRTGVDTLRSLNKLGAHTLIHPGLRLRVP
jgi:membrane-bound lytic murein transglycosylase D